MKFYCLLFLNYFVTKSVACNIIIFSQARNYLLYTKLFHRENKLIKPMRIIDNKMKILNYAAFI